MKSVVKKIKRRDNILYRLRRKGYKVHTQQRTIYLAFGEDPNLVLQIKQLREEYKFTIQLHF